MGSVLSMLTHIFEIFEDLLNNNKKNQLILISYDSTLKQTKQVACSQSFQGVFSETQYHSGIIGNSGGLQHHHTSMLQGYTQAKTTKQGRWTNRTPYEFYN